MSVHYRCLWDSQDRWGLYDGPECAPHNGTIPIWLNAHLASGEAASWVAHVDPVDGSFAGTTRFVGIGYPNWGDYLDGVGDLDMYISPEMGWCTLQVLAMPYVHLDEAVLIFDADVVSGVPESPQHPVAFLSAGPNPFSARTALTFGGLAQGSALLLISDVSGRSITEWPIGVEAGRAGRIIWDARDAAGNPVKSGVYFGRLESSQGTISRRLVLIR